MKKHHDHGERANALDFRERLTIFLQTALTGAYNSEYGLLYRTVLYKL